MFLKPMMYLVGGCNPFQTYQSNGMTSQGRGENRKGWTPQPRFVLTSSFVIKFRPPNSRTITFICFFTFRPVGEYCQKRIVGAPVYQR